MARFDFDKLDIPELAPANKPIAKETYTPKVQKAIVPNVGRRSALPIAVVAIINVIIKSDCIGSPHQLRGFLSHERRASFSRFQRWTEYPTLNRANNGAPTRIDTHAIASGLI
jgi:hypothetical protein